MYLATIDEPEKAEIPFDLVPNGNFRNCHLRSKWNDILRRQFTLGRENHMSETSTKRLPPYIAFATFRSGIKGLAHEGQIPARIDTSALPSMSGGTRTAFIAALRFFDLIDAAGKPFPDLKELATEESAWKKRLREYLESSYENQVKVLSDGTPNLLRQTFEKDYSGASSVLSKSMRFLVTAAQDVGMPVSKPILAMKARGGNRSRGTRRSSKQDNPPPPPPRTGENGGGSQTIEQALLAKFPAFDPAWTDDLKAKWFSGFEKLMAMGKGAPQ